MPQPVIRKGGAELIDRLEPLWLALHAHHQAVQPGFAYFSDEESWRLRRAAYERWLKSEGSFVILAERGAELVGYALVEMQDGPDDTWVTGSRIAELQTLSVAPAERGQGLGTRLLDAVDEELDRLGVGDLLIGALAGNAGARRLYERRGLRPVVVHYARFAASESESDSAADSASGSESPESSVPSES